MTPAVQPDPAPDAVGIPGAPAGRLSEHATPLAYALDLRVDPREARFSGSVRIEARIAEETSLIWMHGRDLTVSAARWVSAEGVERGAQWTQSTTEGVAGVVFDEPVDAGEGTLELTFDAPFGQNLDGLYRVEIGADAYAFTQLEAIAARKMFPSFDEPRFKTPFSLSLTVPEDMVALANTKEGAPEAVGDGWKRVRFAQSEPMPTYLVAIAVGPLDVVDGPIMAPTGVRDRPVALRGIAARGKGPQLAHALGETEAILNWLESYFGIAYPYDKLDVVAVPDFNSGAMENIGLVTFREWLLLVDPETASESQKRAFANVMAHELAHMWFGNLVTMPWWDDIWLNEAFATWMASKVVADLYEDYDAALTQMQETHAAMRADSLASARRIREPIESNHDIRNAFDAITYEKGAAVLEMVEQWLGPGEFRSGIQGYLAAHRHGHATGNDLISALSNGSELPVRDVLESFLDQVGVPLLDVTLSCGARGNHLTLRQSRFRPLGLSLSEEATGAAQWTLPVCVSSPVASARTRRGPALARRSSCRVLAERRETWDLGAQCPEWVLPNTSGNGYYRFSLDGDSLRRMREAGLENLNDRERLAFADSFVAALESGSRPAGALLPELAPLVAAPEISVGRVPMRVFDFVHDHVLTSESERAEFRLYGASLFAPFRSEVLRRDARVRCTVGRRGGNCRERAASPGTNDAARDRVRVGKLTRFVAESLQDEVLRDTLAQQALRYIGFGTDGELHPDALAPDIVGVALRMAIQEADEDGGGEVFDAALSRFRNSEDATLRSRLLAALGSTRDPVLAGRVRTLVLSDAVRSNERLTPLGLQLSMEETRALTWRWMREHFGDLTSRLSPARQGQLPWYVTDFCSEARAQEVEQFFAPKVARLDGGPRNLAGALEAIRMCAARAEFHRESVRQFLRDQAN